MSQRTGYQPPNPYHIARASLAHPLPTWFPLYIAALKRGDYVGAREVLVRYEPDGIALSMVNELIRKDGQLNAD